MQKIEIEIPDEKTLKKVGLSVEQVRRKLQEDARVIGAGLSVGPIRR